MALPKSEDKVSTFVRAATHLGKSVRCADSERSFTPVAATGDPKAKRARLRRYIQGMLARYYRIILVQRVIQSSRAPIGVPGMLFAEYFISDCPNLRDNVFKRSNRAGVGCEAKKFRLDTESKYSLSSSDVTL